MTTSQFQSPDWQKPSSLSQDNGGIEVGQKEAKEIG
jgi:hypothetical protein